MIIFLILLALTVLIITYYINDCEKGIAIVVGCVWVLLHFCFWWSSYDDYVDCRTFYDITKEQYSESITMYEDKAVLSINEKTITDFKYKGYQENMAEMIKELRENVVDYNTTINNKRIYGKNIFFSWFIVEPNEDMKPLKLKEVK